VVASRCGGLPEIVKNKVTGLLFSRGMSTELAECLAKLLNDPRRAKAMGRAGYERYKKYFTLKKHVEEIEKIYKGLLKAG
jgi:glycosyltransferase involved in cell wall biosynthesis